MPVLSISGSSGLASRGNVHVANDCFRYLDGLGAHDPYGDEGASRVPEGTSGSRDRLRRAVRCAASHRLGDEGSSGVARSGSAPAIASARRRSGARAGQRLLRHAWEPEFLDGGRGNSDGLGGRWSVRRMLVVGR